MTKQVALCFALLALIMPAEADTTRKIVTDQTFNYGVTGWEQPLVSKDPNLGRWYWGAMECSSHRRSTAVLTNGDQDKQGQRTCYVKPLHLALPVVPRHASMAALSPDKPAPPKVHLQAPPQSVKTYSPYSRGCASVTKSTAKLSGTLLNVGVKAELKKLHNS